MDIISFIYLLRLLARMLVFPGSFKFWRRNNEIHYNKAMAKRAKNRCDDLAKLVESINFKKSNNLSYDEISLIKYFICLHINVFH